MEIDEDTSEMDELSQAVWTEYETIRGEFSTRILRDVVDNLKFKMKRRRRRDRAQKILSAFKFVEQDFIGRVVSADTFR